MSPLLFLMMFGTIQYGLYFFDAHGTRVGVRETARLGVVKTFPACPGAGTDWQKLQCATKAQIDPITGPVYVKVSAPDGWEKGKPLVVCAMVKSSGAIGLLPMPAGGLITSKTQMSIEVEGAPTGVPVQDNPPAGASWSWC